jgi:hypothetical protein
VNLGADRAEEGLAAREAKRVAALGVSTRLASTLAWSHTALVLVLRVATFLWRMSEDSYGDEKPWLVILLLREVVYGINGHFLASNEWLYGPWYRELPSFVHGPLYLEGACSGS